MEYENSNNGTSKSILIKIILTLCILFVAYLILSPFLYGLYTNYVYNNVESTDLSQESLVNLSLQTDPTKIGDIYGEEIERKVDHDQYTDYEYGKNRYLFIRTDHNDQILTIRVKKTNHTHKDLVSEVNNLKTIKNIKPGDSEDDIINKYGNTYYRKNDKQGFSVIGYVDRINKIDLEFGLNEYDEVFMIHLSRASDH